MWQVVQEVSLVGSWNKLKYDSDATATRKLVKEVYAEISNALKQAEIRNQTLAHHLTSIVCSPNCINAGLLSPDPESVRKLLARDPDKKQRNSNH